MLHNQDYQHGTPLDILLYPTLQMWIFVILFLIWQFATRAKGRALSTRTSAPTPLSNITIVPDTTPMPNVTNISYLKIASRPILYID